MKHDGGWKTTLSKYLFESKWFNLRQDDVTLPSGEPIVYTYVEHPGYALVVPLLDSNELLLERVYRYTLRETVLECPAGGLDGDTPEHAANRELLEETGWSADSLAPLGRYYGSNGISNEEFHIFFATDLRHVGEPNREPTEQITLEKVAFDEAVNMVASGQIVDGPSALGILLTAKYFSIDKGKHA
jgi:8-oxo-dGTP pyrophosphatase MutT (NUDIX family)